MSVIMANPLWMCSRGTGIGGADHSADETVDYVAHDEPLVDRGAAGWRLDAAYAVPSLFWARVLPQVKAAHPYSWIFGEVIHGDYPRIIEESTMDSITQYELWKSIQHALETENFFELGLELQRHNAFPDSSCRRRSSANDVTRIASQIGSGQGGVGIGGAHDGRRRTKHLLRRRTGLWASSRWLRWR